MTKLTFKTMTTSNATFNWDSPYINNVTGIGKTRLVDGLIYCLFGGDYDLRVNLIVEKGGDIYDITRDNALRINKNGLSHTMDIEKDLLEMDKTTFLNSTIYNNKTTNDFNLYFIDKIKNNSKEIQDELIRQLSNNKIRKEKRELELKYKKEEYISKLSFYNISLKQNKKDITTINKEVISLEKQLAEKKDNLKNINIEEVNDFSKEINEYKNIINDIEIEILEKKSYQAKKTTVINSLQDEIILNKHEIDMFYKNFQEYKDNKHEKIKQLREKGLDDEIIKVEEELPPVFDVKQAEGIIESNKTKINDLNNNIIDTDTYIYSLLKTKKLNESLLEKLCISQDKLITQYSIDNSKFKALSDKLKTEINTIESDIKLLNELSEQKTEEIEIHSQKLKELEGLDKEVISIESSFNGINEEIEDIEKQMLPISTWGRADIKKFIIENDLKEAFESYVKEFNLTNYYSSYEKKIYDICMFFALHDLVNNNNIMIFDDVEGYDFFYKFLTLKDKSIFILTRNKINSLYTKNIQL